MNEVDRLVRMLAPHHEVSPSTVDAAGPAAEQLMREIMHQPSLEAAPRRWARLSPRRPLVLAPVAAGLAALIFVVAALLPLSGPGGPQPAHALQIVRTDGYIEIKIVDPVADPARYRAELAAHDLDIELELVPTGPDHVGRVLFEEVLSDPGPAIETIEAPGNCAATANCSVGIRVPVGFESSARVVFGRTARPGETLQGPMPAPQDASEDAKRRARAVTGGRVDDARAKLASGPPVTYFTSDGTQQLKAADVPGTWYVIHAIAMPDDHITLFVAATP